VKTIAVASTTLTTTGSIPIDADTSGLLARLKCLAGIYGAALQHAEKERNWERKKGRQAKD